MPEKKKWSGGHIVKMVLVVGMILGGMILVVTTAAGQKSFDDEYNINTKMIEQLRIDIEEANQEDVFEKEDAIDVLSSAKDAGDAVAKLQNDYVTIPTSTDSSKIKEHANKLGEYFDESSQTGRQPWYKHDGAIWTFQSSYDFSGTTTNVLWLCKTNEGDLLAYATATYDADINMFKNIAYKNTSMGNARIAATDESEEKYYDSIIKQIQDAAGDNLIDENTFTEEELQDIHDAREKLREEQNYINGGDE